jgi:hypothetical protein
MASIVYHVDLWGVFSREIGGWAVKKIPQIKKP